MFTGLEAGRLPMAATLAKPNLLQNGYVSFIRPSRGVACRRRSLPFKGHRRQPVRTAAAEVDEPVPAGQPQRQARVVTVNLEAVKAGDEFTGTVVSVETYGAFVNFGAKSDGLVHISQLSDGFVKSVADKVRVNDTVKVRVLSVDAAQSRVALTMKGMQQLGAPEGDEPEDGYNEEPELEALEEEDMVDFAEDGIGFTVEDDGEAIGEFDEFEYEPVEATGNVEAILHVNDYVEGQVVGVEPFGVFVEFAVAGKKYQGLLHFSEMKVPAALAEAEEQEGEALEGEEEAEAPATVEASGAEEGEYMGEEYVDIGEVNDPSQYYKPGDRVQCFVLSVENEQKIELTQFLEDEEEDEADALLDELDPDGAEIQEVEYYDDDEEEEGAEPATLDVSSGTLDHATLTGQMHFDQIGTSVQTTMGGFILDKQGNFISPRMFPDRTSPGLIDPVALWTPSALDYEDDDGEESELIDYWAVDTKVPKNVLKKLGYKFEKTESGESEVVPRPGKAEAGEEREMSEEELYDLVNMVDDDDIEALVNDLLEDDVEEQELPVLAFRRPRVMAVSVENSKPAISASSVQQLRKATGAGMMDCKKALTECEGDFDKAQEWLRKKGLSGADKKAGRLAAEGVVARYIHPGSRLGVLLEINCETDFVAASDDFQKLVGEVGMVIASTDCVCVSEDEVPPELLAKEREVEMGKEDIKSKPEAIRAKIVDGRIEKIKKSLALMNQDSLRDPSKNITEVVKETIAKVGENIQIRRFVKYRLGEGLEKKSNDFAAEVAAQTQVKEAAPKKEEKKVEEKAAPAAPAIQVSAKVVKELRDKTGAGMMDCKKALAEVEGDMEKATEWLRKKGLASADKKAGRLAAEGVVAAYIHPGSRLGVLLEVNCETDFVAASEKFLQLVNGLAMQIAASQNVQYVTAEDIPAEVFEREKEIEMGREDLKNKPEAIRAKIAEGRVKKIAADMALMEQSYLMDPSKTVTEAIKEAIAAIGEKISVRRFVKFGLGEGLEKKSNDFAAEVAAATSKS